MIQMFLQKNLKFSERLSIFLKNQQFKSSNEFSNSLGYTHSEKINRLFRKKDTKPSFHILYDICTRFPLLDMNWLITGQGTMLKEDNALNESPAALPKLSLENEEPTLAKLQPPPGHNPPHSSEFIPLFDVLATAGNKLRFWESDEHVLDFIPKKFGTRDCDVAIHVYGDSMYPTYMPGDVVLLKEITNHELLNYGHVYVVVTEESRLMKYLRRADDNNFLRLCSENKHYEDILLEKKDIIKLYQVQGFFRKTGI